MTNTEIVKKVHDLFSQNKFNEVMEYIADDVVIYSFAMNTEFRGKEEFTAFMSGFKNAFPDLNINHTNIFCQGSWVCVEFTCRGTHTGQLQTPAGPVEATGKEVLINACEIMEIENGKVKQIRNYQDSLSLMRQLGLMK